MDGFSEPPRYDCRDCPPLYSRGDDVAMKLIGTGKQGLQVLLNASLRQCRQIVAKENIAFRFFDEFLPGKNMPFRKAYGVATDKRIGVDMPKHFRP